MEPRYLTSSQAAAYLGISVNALKQRMHRQTIPAWCWTRSMGDRTLRFIRTALVEWMEPAERMAVAREVAPLRKVEPLRHGKQSANVDPFPATQKIGRVK